MTNDEAFFNALFSSEKVLSAEGEICCNIVKRNYHSFVALDATRRSLACQSKINQSFRLMINQCENSHNDLKSILKDIEASIDDCSSTLEEDETLLKDDKELLVADEASLEEDLKELMDEEASSPYLNFLKHDIKIRKYQIREWEELIEENQGYIRELKELAVTVKERLDRKLITDLSHEWTKCPRCGSFIKTKHLARHEKKVHGLIWTIGEIRSVQKCVRLSGQVSAENSVGKKCNIQKRSNIKKYIPKRKSVPLPNPMNNAEIEEMKRKNLEQMERIAKDRERMKRLKANGYGRLS